MTSRAPSSVASQPPGTSGEVAAATAAALELGWRALRARRVDEALEICEAVLSLEPTNTGAMYLIVTALHQAELRPRALGLLERAIDLDPAAPPAWHAHRGLLLIELDRAGEAVGICRAALQRTPGDPHLLCVLGLAYKAMGKTSAAVAALARAARRPDAQPSVHGELARLLMAENRLEPAVTEYATALHLGGHPMEGRHVGAYPTATVREWSRRHGTPYTVVIPGRDGRTFWPRYDDTAGDCRPVPRPQPEIYLAEVPDASVVGGLTAVIAADTALLDVAFEPAAARFDLAQDAMPYADGRAALVDAAAVAAEPIEAGIFLQGPASANYYHWLVEHLSRLLILERAGVPADLPLLIDAAVFAIPQLVDALAVVDAAARPVIALQPGVEYRVRRLLIPGPVVWAPPNLRDHLPLEVGDNLVAAEAIDFLRSRLSPAAGSVGSRRIYVARRARTAGRRLTNEPEVRRVFEEAGFEVVSPEGLTFAEQRDLFGSAAVVAAESGAALTNMLAAPASTMLICLQAEPWEMNVYADLVGHAGQPSVFLPGRPEPDRPPKPYQARFAMDPEALARTVARILQIPLPASTAGRQPESRT
jgi:capsular polysaccharide biosynthesis protein